MSRRTPQQLISALARRLERERFRWHVRRVAWQAESVVDLDLAPTARIHHRVRFKAARRIEGRLVIGDGSKIEEDVILQLQAPSVRVRTPGNKRVRGGEIVMGDGLHIRRGCLIKSRGRLELHDRVVFGDYCSVQCANEIVLEERVGLSYGVMVVDSSHVQDAEDNWFYAQTEEGRVHIGANTWLASFAIVGRNATIGRQCIIGGNTTFLGADLPDGHTALGSPPVIRPNPSVLGPGSEPAAQVP